MKKNDRYNNKHVFAAACTGMLVFGISLITLGTILPDIITDFALDEKTTGLLVALLPVGLLAGSLVFGPVADRYGYKTLMIVSTILVLTGLEGIAWGNYILYIQVSVFLIGSGGGVLNGATNALVNDISGEDRSSNLSFLGVFFGVGALGMPALIGILSAFMADKIILAGVGMILLGPVVYFLLIRFPEPKKTQQIPLREVFKLLKNFILIFAGLILFLESGIEGVINNWTTTFLQQANDLNKQEALFSLSSFVLSLSVSRFVLGFLLKRVLSSTILLVGTAITATGLMILLCTTNYIYSLTSLFLLGMGCAAVFPVILSYVGKIFSKISGTAFSIVMVIAVSGNILINYFMGLASHWFGINHFITILFISLLIMLILLIIFINRIKHQIKI